MAWFLIKNKSRLCYRNDGNFSWNLVVMVSFRPEWRSSAFMSDFFISYEENRRLSVKYDNVHQSRRHWLKITQTRHKLSPSSKKRSNSGRRAEVHLAFQLTLTEGTDISIRTVEGHLKCILSRGWRPYRICTKQTEPTTTLVRWTLVMFVYCCFSPKHQYLIYIIAVIWCMRWEGESQRLYLYRLNKALTSHTIQELAFDDDVSYTQQGNGLLYVIAVTGIRTSLPRVTSFVLYPNELSPHPCTLLYQSEYSHGTMTLERDWIATVPRQQ